MSTAVTIENRLTEFISSVPAVRYGLSYGLYRNMESPRLLARELLSIGGTDDAYLSLGAVPGETESLEDVEFNAVGLARILKPESEIFGCNCVSICLLVSDGDKRAKMEAILDILTRILDWCHGREACLITVQLPGPDPIQAQALEYFGFYQTETLIHLARVQQTELNEVFLPYGFEFISKPDSTIDIKKLLDQIKLNGAFSNDLNINVNAAKEITDAKIIRQTEDSASRVLIIKSETQPVGLTIFSPVNPDGSNNIPSEGRLSVLGIASTFQGQGWGRAILTESLRRFQQEFSLINVNVSACNLPAIRLYQSLGFFFSHTSARFHCRPALDGVPAIKDDFNF